jgi:hypothetical protein
MTRRSPRASGVGASAEGAAGIHASRTGIASSLSGADWHRRIIKICPVDGREGRSKLILLKFASDLSCAQLAQNGIRAMIIAKGASA